VRGKEKVKPCKEVRKEETDATDLLFLSLQSVYYGGARVCDAGGPAGAEAPDFDPKSLICPSCLVNSVECDKHGKDYVEFKCR
jgi:hypothetical protein